MNNNWDEFCTWLVDDLELGKLPIEWKVIHLTPPKNDTVDPVLGSEIVRIDLFKDKPYKVSVGIPNNTRYMTHELSYYIARNLLLVIRDAIKTKSPHCFIPYTWLKESM